MIPTAHQRLRELPALTGIRGIAALWVLLFHVWALSGQPSLELPAFGLKIPLSGLLTTGWAGVDIFFTLSAFLLTLPFAIWRLGVGEKPSLSHYFQRRILRIFPAYYAQLAILLALAAGFDVGHTLGLHEFLAHLALWLLVGADPVMPLNGVWFTLPIEFCFYLLLPSLVLLLRPRLWIVLLVGAVLLTWIWRALAYHWVADLPIPSRVNLIEQLPGRLDQFVIGMLAAYAYARNYLADENPRHPVWLFAIGCAGLALMCAWIAIEVVAYWNGEPLLLFWHTLASCFLGLVFYACAWDAPVTRHLLANRPLHVLGEISFGVYLWHFPIITWLQPWVGAATSPARLFALNLALVLPLTLIAAYLSYAIIERPFLRIRRMGGRHPGLETPLPAARRAAHAPNPDAAPADSAG